LQNFDYVSAKTVEEVVSLLNDPRGRQARILSGGTDLIVQMREGRRSADLVIDIKRVPDANALAFSPESGLLLGAAVSCMKVCAEPMVRSLYPGLVDAFSLIGGTQIQGRASVGGNLCNASPAADAIPALIVHGAVAIIAGAGGWRSLPVDAFCVAPGRNALAEDEFLVAVRIPAPEPRGGESYLRFIPRNEMDIAVVGVGAKVRLAEDRETIETARVALGAVGPIPIFAREAGEFLAGKTATPENITEAARIAQAAARPITDMRGTAEQRRHLVMVLTRRALAKAIDRAKGTGGDGARANGGNGAGEHGHGG
jgi:carbon-monoxide dehydrogenase medium subunit